MYPSLINGSTIRAVGRGLFSQEAPQLSCCQQTRKTILNHSYDSRYFSRINNRGNTYGSTCYDDARNVLCYSMKECSREGKFPIGASMNQTVRNHSIFKRQPKDDDQPWHNNPSFMEDSSLEEKEQWLKSVISKDRFKQNEIDGKYGIELSGLRVDSEAYLFLLRALSQSDVNSAPQKCEQIMSKLERKFNAAKELYDDMVAKNESDQQSISIMRDIVLDLKPTTECYDEVIRAWSNTHKPIIARTERWLDTLRRNREYHNKSRNQPSDKKSNVQLDEFEHLVQSKAMATTESYNLFLKTISKGNATKSQVLIRNATKAKSLLGEMMTIYDETGDSNVQPNTESFNYVLREYLLYFHA